MAAALAAMAFAGEKTPYLVFVVPLVVAGIGMMLTQAPAANVFVAKPPPALVGAIGSSRTAFGQFGCAGLALSSSLIYGMFSPLLRQRLDHAGATPGEQAQAIEFSNPMCRPQHGQVRCEAGARSHCQRHDRLPQQL
jgi:hypothetical protein